MKNGDERKQAMGLSYLKKNIKKLGIMKSRDYLDLFKILLSFPFGMMLKLFRRVSG